MRSSNHLMKLTQFKGSDDKRLNSAHKLPLQSWSLTSIDSWRTRLVVGSILSQALPLKLQIQSPPLIHTPEGI